MSRFLTSGASILKPGQEKGTKHMPKSRRSPVAYVRSGLLRIPSLANFTPPEIQVNR